MDYVFVDTDILIDAGAASVKQWTTFINWKTIHSLP
jgi:hypothetical protein